MVKLSVIKMILKNCEMKNSTDKSRSFLRSKFYILSQELHNTVQTILTENLASISN